MNVQFDADFVKKLKKQNVLIRKSFKQRIIILSKNPNYPKLNNHSLKDKWQGYRSIDINADWRVIYKEIQTGEGKVAYFVTIGTHKELYK
jgi:addiction module RelE/StbE family toxin